MRSSLSRRPFFAHAARPVWLCGQKFPVIQIVRSERPAIAVQRFGRLKWRTRLGKAGKRFPERRVDLERAARQCAHLRRLMQQLPGIADGADAAAVETVLEAHVGSNACRVVSPVPKHPVRAGLLNNVADNTGSFAASQKQSAANFLQVCRKAGQRMMQPPSLRRAHRAGLISRFVKYVEANRWFATFERLGQRLIVMDPQIPAKPDNNRFSRDRICLSCRSANHERSLTHATSR